MKEKATNPSGHKTKDNAENEGFIIDKLFTDLEIGVSHYRAEQEKLDSQKKSWRSSARVYFNMAKPLLRGLPLDKLNEIEDKYLKRVLDVDNHL